MKDYAQYKSTFVKPKQSKAIANAIEEIEKYCKGMICYTQSFTSQWSILVSCAIFQKVDLYV